MQSYSSSRYKMYFLPKTLQVNTAIAGLAPGTSIFFAQPYGSEFDGLGPAIASAAQAQAANVALLRLTQQLGGIMGSIFPLPTLYVSISSTLPSICYLSV